MRFIKLALVGLASFIFDLCRGEEEAGLPQIQFNLSYAIPDKQPVGSAGGFLEFDPYENLTLFYSLANHEESDIEVVGMGGEVLDLTSGEVVANVSIARIGPLEILTNHTENFEQVVNLVLNEGEYFLSPHIFVNKLGETMKVVANPTLIRILPPTMSFFDPKFLFIQIILFGLLVAYCYWGAATGLTKAKNKSRRSEKHAKKIESSWLPDNHR
ncbi:LAMI_0E05688g1_1 [Lachancea mirantina]|uniref:Increased recombination centers protein 22 n=1 Tax=Lachancea mirantina TaxID=1230905 RepID=A0A1G4JLA6_9SACH|nr:LAMI_0E05688g1_1 [Lachancea mirantina]